MSVEKMKPVQGPESNGETGSTFVTVLLFSIMLAVIVGAAMSRSLFTWKEIGVSYNHDRALHTTESGIDMTLFAVNHNAVEDIDSYASTGFGAVLRSLAGHGEITGLTGSVEDPSGEKVGDFESAVDIDPTNENRLILTATGTVPAGEIVGPKSSRTIRVVVFRDTVPMEAYRTALWSPGTVWFNGITYVAGDVVSGATVESTPNTDPHERVEPNEYIQYDPETGEPYSDYGEIDEARNTDPDNNNNFSLPYGEFILQGLKELAKDQGNYYETAPQSPEQLKDTYWYDEAARIPNVTFISSDLKYNGQVNLGGLIVVIGDVSFGGNANIDGIIYCTGKFDTHGGGNTSINVDGGVFCGSAELEGHAVLEYNYEYMEALAGLVLQVNKYRVWSWQELLPERETVETAAMQL